MTELPQYGQYTVPTSDKCVALRVGQPSNSHLPLNEFLYNSSTAAIRPGLLQYGKIEGYDEFRIDLAKFLSDEYNTLVKHDNLLVTNGISFTLPMLITRYAGKYKDVTIFCENPTYFLALNIFKEMGLIVKSINMNSDGLDIKKLSKKLENINTDKPVFLYTIPISHNPTGYTLSHEKRIELSKLADKHKNLIVLADEVYHLLSFDNELKEDKNSVLPMCSYHKNFLSLNTFSKIFAPGVRLGWIQADKSHIDFISGSAILDSSGAMNPIMSAYIHESIKNGFSDENFKMSLQFVKSNWIKFLKTNCDVLYNEINIQLKDYIVDVQKPKGGYFLWIQFKKHISTSKLFDKMLDYGITFLHGNKFSPDESLDNCMRVSFSWYQGDDYKLAISRLKQLLDEQFKTKIYILGHNGKLGNLITKEIAKTDNLSFVRGLGKEIDISYITNDDIIIDVSRAEGTIQLLTKLLEYKVYPKIIIGTTGHDESILNNLIKEYATKNAIAKTSNFSYGISLFKKLISVIDTTKWNVKMSEVHHIHKIDKPSGTSKILADAYNSKYSLDTSNLNNDLIKPENIDSFREGETPGIHTLILDDGSQTISIEHVAKSRDLFAKDCIKWINFIINKKGGIWNDIFN